MSLQQSQTAEIAHGLGSAVHIALADAPRAETNNAAGITIAGGDDLARAALDDRRVEVAWLAAKTDRDAAGHRRLRQHPPQVGVIRRRGQLNTVPAHAEAPRRKGPLPVVNPGANRYQSALQC